MSANTVYRVTDILPKELIDVLLPLGRLEQPWVYLEYKTGGPGNQYLVRFRVDRLPPLLMNKRYKAADLVSNYVLSRWLAHGPKVARVPAAWCPALAQIEVRLQVADLSFPYPELLVELPPGAVPPYRSVLIGRLEGGEVVLTLEDPTHTHDLISIIRQRHEPGWTVEETLEKYAPDCVADAVPANRALRIALNAALLLTGDTRLTDALPAEAASDRRLAKETTDRGARARSRLQSALQVAHFDQTINFPLPGSVRAASPGANDGEPSYEVSPHWRRGHWRMQAYGPKNGLRKRILVPPVLVRADRFCGDTADSFTIYRKSE